VSWPLVNINDICRPKQWKTVSSSKLLEEGYPVYGANGRIGYYSEYTHEFPTLMITCRGATCGNVHISVPKAYINGNAMALDGLDSEKYSIKYLFYYFKSRGFNDVISGSAQPQITRQGLSKIEIPLPPLPVQKQIAAVLEKADTLRSQCQQMEHELNSLAQSVFLDMFGDYRKSDQTDFTTLGDCADVCSGVTKGQKFGDKPTVTVPYMRVANVQDGYLDLNEIKEIEAKITDYEKYLLKVGDVLMTEGGDFDKLGRGAVWEGQIDGCIHQNHVFRVRLGERYLPKFFEYLLQSQYAKQYFLKCAKKTTNLASINITQLKSLPMPQVDLKSQQEFVSFISKLDEHKKHLEQTKQQLDENFNSLMQRAFKGELDLKDVA
jgi:type I restriction enzyme S subunit